jgi:hypothetical protein
VGGFMTNEQINVAIAEHCGFTDIMWPTGFHQKMSDEKSKQAGGRWRFQIPDYCNDLNAMHEKSTPTSYIFTKAIKQAYLVLTFGKELQLVDQHTLHLVNELRHL